MSFTAETVAKLRGIVDTSCTGADDNTSIPGTTVVVVDKNGNDLFTHSAGKRGLVSSEPMSPETIFWIASCTKMLAGVACMQLVEKGVLKLDDGEHLEKLCPELQTKQVLRPDGTFEKKNKAITLRMLLTHTSGFGYAFFNERLRDWSFPGGIDEFSGRAEDIMEMPLLFQPGEGWEYGVSIDWAGIALQRATGLTLNDYLQKHVLQPLGLTNMSMIPTPEMRAKVAYMHAREKDEVLAVLLNDGTCPRTGVQLLRKETVDEMFRNQIPDFPNFGRQGIPDAKPDLTNPLPDLYPVAGNPPQGWGLTFMLSNGGATGRSKSTGFWAGLANCWWWCDREHGVAGMVCTQILPFADAKVLGLWIDVEAEVYKALV
ncbi:putative beta-lactamase family protein [Eutypa lata UCREL1]|uniref:Putative beta-lactamase family protein n=1 Tax=Eutypa lata (strain UCR-EL1) TaxID=1287681 RepID=M7SQ24_EUTLA|nr:putative beta-lactamase family protein [Eutypa lata UCREL1]